MANEDQIEYWNEKAGPEWVAEQSRLDRTVVVHGDKVLEEADIRAGHSVLDVGCGTGQTTVAAAEAAGASGSVVGVDVSRVMLQAARDRARESGVAVDFRQGDAQEHDLGEASFDRIISRFGVMFFDDPRRAFTNIGRAAKPGGKLTFVCWQSIQANPWVAIPARAVGQVVPLPERDPDAPGPFALADDSLLREVLENSGWKKVEIGSVERTMGFGDGSVESAVDFLTSIGPVSAVLREIEDPNTKERALAAMREAIEGQAQGGQVAFGSATWLVQAQR